MRRKVTADDKARIAAESARKTALRDSATREGVRGLYDELAVLCGGCGTPMLILCPEERRGAEGGGGFLCFDCGARRFMGAK